MWYVCAFYTMLSLSQFCIGKFDIYISCVGVILPLELNYTFVSIDMFVHHITVSELICLYMLNKPIIGCTSSWYLPLYLSCARVILPLLCCYICVWIRMFVNIISMFNAICLCTLRDILLVGTKLWGRLLHIFTDLFSQWFHTHLQAHTIVY